MAGSSARLSCADLPFHQAQEESGGRDQHAEGHRQSRKGWRSASPGTDRDRRTSAPATCRRCGASGEAGREQRPPGSQAVLELHHREPTHEVRLRRKQALRDHQEPQAHRVGDELEADDHARWSNRGACERRGAPGQAPRAAGRGRRRRRGRRGRGADPGRGRDPAACWRDRGEGSAARLSMS